MSFIDEKTQQFYDDLERRMKSSEEELEKRRRNNHAVGKIRQAGHVLKSISNLYWTTRGAPPQQIDPPPMEEDQTDEQIGRRRERMMKAYESLAKLRMADAKSAAAIDLSDSRRRNEERRTNALIDYQQNKQNNENKKTEAEIDNIHSRISLTSSQAALAQAQTEHRKQETANLGERHQQEGEIRKAKAQQAWAAARRQPSIRPRTNLRARRRRRRK